MNSMEWNGKEEHSKWQNGMNSMEWNGKQELREVGTQEGREKSW
jgi:hypothetical protein